jgi:hypothetical protein
MSRSRARVGEGGDEIGGIFGAGGVVRRDEDDGADAAGEAGAGGVEVGKHAAPQGIGTISMPVWLSHIWWLKYHGTGSITASPGAARVAMAAQKARLQPGVIATSSGSIRPP